MSSTYAHYTASSASVTTDYGLLARYAAAHPTRIRVTVSEEGTEDGETEDSNINTPGHSPSRRRHRRSISPGIRRPLLPTMGSLPPPYNDFSEATPLLGPRVPLIVEEGDVAIEGMPKPSTFAMYREEAKILIKYALPVWGTQMLEHAVVVTSVIFIGHLSTVALAASALGSMTASVTGYSFLAGFANTLDTVLPSAWTSDQPQLVGLWAQRMLVIMLAISIPVASIWFNAESILRLLNQDPEVARLAALYLRWAILGLPAYSFNQVARRYFQSQGLFALSTQVTLCVAPINVLLNYMLVWGPESIRLGFIGAPIAASISFTLISLMSFAYGVFWVPRTAWYPLSRRMFTSLGILTQLGIAGAGQTASEWWSWEFVGIAASQFGPVALATQSVLLVTGSTTFQAYFSLSIAASVRIGNLLGEKNARRAGVALKTAFSIALVLDLISCTLLLTFRNSWSYLFNDDPEVVALVASILPLVAFYQLVDGISVCSSGVLRARGKQATGALISLSAYYVLGIPLGLWLAFARGWDLMGLWVGLTSSLVYQAVVGLWLNLRTDWDREVRKVEMRLEKERVAMEYERVRASEETTRC